MQEIILPPYADGQKTKVPSAELYADAFKWLFKATTKIVRGFFQALFEPSPIDQHIEEARYKARLYSHL